MRLLPCFRCLLDFRRAGLLPAVDALADDASTNGDSWEGLNLGSFHDPSRSPGSAASVPHIVTSYKRLCVALVKRLASAFYHLTVGVCCT